MKRRLDTTSSRTAAWTCLCRAVSSLEKNPGYRCDDGVALSLLPVFIKGVVRIPWMGRLFLRAAAAKGIYEYVIARTKYIDAVFRQSLDRRFSQILLFGAGFDTRALRFGEAEVRARVFELDAPPTQEAKIRQYRKRRLTVPPSVVFVPIDFDRESLPQKLDQAGFKRGERSLFVLEGVVMYLQPQSVDDTFRTIQTFAGAGSEVVFDYIYASVLRGEEACYGEKGMAKSVAKRGEQWHFGIEKGRAGEFLSRYGFHLTDHRDGQDLEEMYFKDPSGRLLGRVNATHCLTRGVRRGAPGHPGSGHPGASAVQQQQQPGVAP